MADESSFTACQLFVNCSIRRCLRLFIMNVYFISGLGADRRAFEKINLPERFSIHHLDWIQHNQGESLNDYAKRLAATIDTTQPFAIVGLSMGGFQFFH